MKMSKKQPRSKSRLTSKRSEFESTQEWFFSFLIVIYFEKFNKTTALYQKDWFAEYFYQILAILMPD